MNCLGQFVPSRLDGPTIAKEFRAWLRARGIEPREPQLGVRTPEDTARACRATPVLMEWHRDGCAEPTNPTDAPSVQTLIVWSNGTPTRIRLKSGAEAIHAPFSVIQVDNIREWHASPPPEDGRWFVGISDPIVKRVYA